MKTIALCMNHVQWIEWDNPFLGKRYPGAGWIPEFVRLAAKKDFNVVGGSCAIQLLKDHEIDPLSTFIVQEEMNEAGMGLCKIGAQPKVIFCLESPIFACEFYDEMMSGVRKFKNTLLFHGGTDHIYFPSFDDEDIQHSVPWSERKFLCMVTANKHYSMLPKIESTTLKYAFEHQLHDYRMQAIQYFHGKPGFDLYGKGWGAFAPECHDKLATVREYKFSLCFENGRYPGYVTEKIIDCLVAGVIPVYLGAPDIDQFVPASLYISSDRFTDWAILHRYLEGFSSKEAAEMIRAGRKWLIEGEGKNYNNRVFAERLLGMCA